MTGDIPLGTLTSSDGTWTSDVFDNYEMPWGCPPYQSNPSSFVESAMWIHTDSVNEPLSPRFHRAGQPFHAVPGGSSRVATAAARPMPEADETNR